MQCAGQGAVVAWMLGVMKGAMEWATVPVLALAMALPHGALVYWLSSSLCSLAQVRLGNGFCLRQIQNGRGQYVRCMHPAIGEDAIFRLLLCGCSMICAACRRQPCSCQLRGGCWRCQVRRRSQLLPCPHQRGLQRM